MDPTTPTPPGVIFDLDGTLADTLQDLTEALNATLADEHLAPRPPEQVRSFIGDGLATLLSRAAETEDPERIAALIGRFREHYAGNYLRHTLLYAGLEAVLDALRQVGCPLAVLSNKRHDFTRWICDGLLERWPLVEAVGTRPGGPKKPDPSEALRLAERMQRSCGDVVLVGDSDTDVQTARAAGMRSVAVTWGFRDRPLLVASEPDRLVDRPEELLDAILTPLPR